MSESSKVVGGGMSAPVTAAPKVSATSTLVEVFVLRGRDFCLLELVEIRLYLGASLCIYLF